MGSANTAYEKGILGIIADPFGAGLCLLIAIFFVGILYRANIKTIIDFLRLNLAKMLEFGFLCFIFHHI